MSQREAGSRGRGNTGMTRRGFVRLGALAALACSLPLPLSACAGKGGGSDRHADPDPSESLSTTATENEDGSLTMTLFAFDTVIQVTAWCDQSLLDEVAKRCTYFDETLSPLISGSDVWNINQAAGAPVEVKDSTADLIAKSLVYCERSGGKLDITIGTVSLLWDFDNGVKPDDADIAAGLPHIDYHLVEVEGNTVTVHDPLTKLDLGATAKGYIADDLARILLEGGCESALIDLGGNIYALGTKPDGSQWNIGIQDPNDNRGAIIASTHVENGSVVTSGLYERQFELDGTTYYHILDPKTGYPVVTDLESSSILSDSSLDGDAYSTILFLNGSAAALDIVESTPEIEAVLIDSSGRVLVSTGADIELEDGSQQGGLPDHEISKEV